METTKHENFINNYKIITNKINELKSKKYDYKINCSCEPFGYIKNMQINDVIKASVFIHNDINNNKSFKQLEIIQNNLSNNKYLGFSIDDWDHDFILRIDEIHDKKELKKFNEIIKMIQKKLNN